MLSFSLSLSLVYFLFCLSLSLSLSHLLFFLYHSFLIFTLSLFLHFQFIFISFVTLVLSLPLSLSFFKSKQGRETLTIEPDFHPFICGPNNSSIISLQDSTGTRINVPPFNSGKSDITITGEKEGVAQVAAKIRQVYQSVVS